MAVSADRWLKICTGNEIGWERDSNAFGSWRHRDDSAECHFEGHLGLLKNGLPGLTRIDAVSSEMHTSPHADDQSLVERMVCGDGQAWQRFVQQHGRLVRSRVADVAAAFGRSEDDSAIDDATAEVFAALLGNDAAALRAFAGRSSLGTYVAVIATRSATRGFARKRIVVASSIDTDLNQAAGVATGDPAHDLIDAEQHRRLHVMLSRLPQKQRDVVRMFHLQSKSYSDISDQLQMPIGSIGPTLRRAEAKLREWMEND
jgi:RNA polymerase sigma-70 factor (ECF subfamily)